LVIDDDETIRTLIRDLIQSDGHDVAEAGDGVEGLERFRENPCDLVIVDLAMPRMSGSQVVEVLRREAPETRIIVLTAYLSRATDTVGALGVDRVFLKPARLHELLAAVQELVGET
jgi:two-component system response regulator (stage 0 sporulation protein F)